MLNVFINFILNLKLRYKFFYFIWFFWKDLKNNLPFSGVCEDIPAYPFDEQYDKFAFTSFLTREESIQTCVKLRTECNKVAVMSLFHVPTTKPMKIDEFEQTQSQATSQVILFFFLRNLSV